MSSQPEALLALEDGRVFRGRSFGAPGERCGEAVFNTSMTGYQEILTDPSYTGQIVTMTYPLIGNYGVNPEDAESARVRVEGLIVKECCRVPSNWRSRQALPEYLQEHGVVGIEGVDTRALTLHIRTAGAMKAAASTLGRSADELVQMARDWEGLVGRDLITQASTPERYTWDGSEGGRLRVVVYDFGVKFNMLRLLAERGCEVVVVPATTPAEEALALEPDGFLMSNGPGDPAGAPHVAAEVRKLLDRDKPLFGICMGQQILALALGGKTFKLKFGHRGANHPVQELSTKRVDITSQNHGFCVDIDSLPADDIELTHINLNDQTLEGFRHKHLPLFSVQYHPEASPGPHDAAILFDRFVALMDERKKQ